MADITVRLFGFGSRASGFETEFRKITTGTTVRQVWDNLRAGADDTELLARIDERSVVFLINGRIIGQDRISEATLEDGDTLTCMVLAMGGQSCFQKGGDSQSFPDQSIPRPDKSTSKTFS
jgi:hypothetical protein